MPNYVYHKLVFDADHLPKAMENVIDEHNEVNFNRLVPMPPNLYHGSLGPEEEKDSVMVL
jgi:hypothetical protein